MPHERRSTSLDAVVNMAYLGSGVVHSVTNSWVEATMVTSTEQQCGEVALTSKPNGHPKPANAVFELHPEVFVAFGFDFGWFMLNTP